MRERRPVVDSQKNEQELAISFAAPLYDMAQPADVFSHARDKQKIAAVVDIVRSVDQNTGCHIMRTVCYAKVLADKAVERGYCTDVLTESYIDAMLQGAYLHDIGKIAIPSKILNKPGKLTPDEFDVVKTHTVKGGKIVKRLLGSSASSNYLDCGWKIATLHHEKWDGSGYPFGLVGESIPVCARITAIADVYDALVSKRPYKEAMPAEQALSIISEESGTHFAPELVEIFLDAEYEIKYIAEAPVSQMPYLCAS